MKNIPKQDLKELDELIRHIENELIGEHPCMPFIDEGIKQYAEAYHKMMLKSLPDKEQLPE